MWHPIIVFSKTNDLEIIKGILKKFKTPNPTHIIVTKEQIVNNYKNNFLNTIHKQSDNILNDKGLNNIEKYNQLSLLYEKVCKSDDYIYSEYIKNINKNRIGDKGEIYLDEKCKPKIREYSIKEKLKKIFFTKVNVNSSFQHHIKGLSLTQYHNGDDFLYKHYERFWDINVENSPLKDEETVGEFLPCEEIDYKKTYDKNSFLNIKSHNLPKAYITIEKEWVEIKTKDNYQDYRDFVNYLEENKNNNIYLTVFNCDLN